MVIVWVQTVWMFIRIKGCSFGEEKLTQRSAIHTLGGFVSSLVWCGSWKWIRRVIMAPAATLDWSEPCQHWRYPKFCPSGQQKHERAKSAMELSSKEANTAYKKFCKFLRRLKHKKRKFFVLGKRRTIVAPRFRLGSVTTSRERVSSAPKSGTLTFEKLNLSSFLSCLWFFGLFGFYTFSWKLKGDSLFEVSNF